MPKGSLFATGACRRTINQVQLRELANFLIKYRSAISIQDTRLLLAAKSFIETPINVVYTRLMEAGKDKLFGFVNVPVNLTAPEILTFSHITYDVRQMDEDIRKTIDLAPEFKDRIVLNVTSLVKANAEVSNTGLFQSLIVRDLLSRSYFQSNDSWLNTWSVQYLCKTYSMSVIGAIARFYNLTVSEQQQVRAIFSLYFLKQVASSEDAEAMLLTGDKLLASTVDIPYVISHVKRVLQGNYATMSLNDAIRCSQELGINRLSDLNLRILYSKMINVGPDANTSMISLEYPPYWAYLVLLAASGQKTGLSFMLKNFGLMREATEFSDRLARDTAFQYSLN